MNALIFFVNTLLIFSKYKAAEQDDLWQYLTEQANRDNTLPKDVMVKKIMDTWTLQMGFPVVNVERDYSTQTATISQDRSGINTQLAVP